MGGILALGLAQSPLNWGIYADSTGNGAVSVQGTVQCRDTFWLVVDTTGMAAAGITGWGWFHSTGIANVVYDGGSGPFPYFFPPSGIFNKRKIGILPNLVSGRVTYVFSLRLYRASGDSVEYSKSFVVKGPSGSLSYIPQVVCTDTVVSFSVNVVEADSFAVDAGSTTVKNQTSFTLTAPSTAGTWNLTLTLYSCGQSQSITYPVNVVNNTSPSPWINFSLSVSPSRVCPGSAVWVTVSSSSGAYNPQEADSYKVYIDDPTAGPWSLADTTFPVQWTVPSGAPAGDYIVRVVLYYPCRIDTFSGPAFRVYGASSLTTPTLSRPSAYCPGTPAYLSLFPAEGLVSWDIGNDGTWDYVGTDHIQHTFSSIPSGGVPIKIKQDVGCYSRTDTVTFNPNTSGVNPYGFITATQALCPGDTVMVSLYGSNFNAFSWVTNWAGTIPGLSQDTIFVLPNTAGNYNLSAILTNGCGSPDTTFPVDFSVPSSYSFSPPFLSFIGAVCASAGGTVKGVHPYPDPNMDSVRYVPESGTAFTAGIADTVSFSVPAGRSSFSVVATYYWGCNKVGVRSYDLPVLVQPTRIITSSVSPSNVCPGAPVNWFFSVYDMKEMRVYVGSTLVSSSSQMWGTFSAPSTPGTYTVKFVAVGCGGNDTVDKMLLVAGSGAVAYFTAPSACVGQPVTFQRSGTNAGVQSVEWDFGDGNSLFDTAMTVSHTYTGPGFYTVGLFVRSAGCGSSSYSQQVRVYGGGPSLSGLNVSLSSATINYSVSATDYDSVKWFFGDGGSALGLSGSYTYTTNGTYTVRAIAYNPCGTDTLQQSVTISTAALASRVTSVEGWVAYPNPAQDVVVLSHLTYQGPAEVRVFDLSGRVVRTASLVSVPGELRVSGLPAGLYSVHLRTAEGVAVLRLVVE